MSNLVNTTEEQEINREIIDSSIDDADDEILEKENLPIYDKNIHFLPSDIIRVYGADKNTILRKEKSSEIPKSIRVRRGKILARAWTVDQLPQIGECLGFLKKVTGTHVISVFTLKGGTLKTSLTFQLSRTLALHGVKVLIVGLDVQESITSVIRPATNEDDVAWDEKDLNKRPKGLFNVLAEDEAIENVILDTDIPTLKFIPETLELSILDRWLKLQRNQEQIIKNKIVKKLENKFNVIIFDCNPSWDTIVDNALQASDILLSPMTCSSDTYRAMRVFSKLMADYVQEAKHCFKSFKIIPTRKKPTKVSSVVELLYKTEYDSLCTKVTIRDSVLAEESNSIGKSLIEISDHGKGLTQDYIALAKEVSDLISTEEKGLTNGLH